MGKNRGSQKAVPSTSSRKHSQAHKCSVESKTRNLDDDSLSTKPHNSTLRSSTLTQQRAGPPPVPNEMSHSTSELPGNSTNAQVAPANPEVRIINCGPQTLSLTSAYDDEMTTDSATESDQASTLAMPKLPANILGVMFSGTQFMDVALFGGQENGEALQPVQAHKVVLAASSDFFSTLFASNGFTDSNKSEYTLDRVSHDILKLIVQVLYKGKATDKRINVDVKFACDMLEASKYLLMDYMALACESILIKHHLTVANCIYLWNYACKYPNLNKLTAEVEQFLAKSLPSVMLDISFLNMEADKLCRMMRINLMETLGSPDARFRAAFAWLEHDAGARRSVASDILATIPLTAGKISRQALIEASSSEALTEDATRKILELLGKSLKVAEFLADPDFNAPSASPAVSSSCFSSAQTDVGALFCITGIDRIDWSLPEEYETMLLKYEVSSKTWRRLKSLPWEPFFGAAFVVRDRLTLFGGEINQKDSSSVYEYDTLTEDSSWHVKQGCQWPYWAKYLLACSARDTAYVCVQESDFFEYAPVDGTNYFKRKPPMVVERVRKSMTLSPTLDAVYVAGGLSNNGHESPQREIEKFDVTSDAWQTIGSAASDHHNFGSVLCGEHLYLIGGDYKSNRAVEKFNVRTGKACKVPSLLSTRSFCQAAMLYNNVICAFGGNHKSVEAYDVREGKWSVGVVVPDMPHEITSRYRLAWK